MLDFASKRLDSPHFKRRLSLAGRNAGVCGLTHQCQSLGSTNLQHVLCKVGKMCCYEFLKNTLKSTRIWKSPAGKL